MKKNYFYFLLICLLLSATTLFAQESKQQPKVQDNAIEGLNFYPNPVTNGKLYITSKNNEDKQIAIFDVLGKKMEVKINNENSNNLQLDLSNASTGIYFVKIQSNNQITTKRITKK